MTTIYKTYQRRGYLSSAGYRQLSKVLSECAPLYNACLQERRDAYKMEGIRNSWVDQFKSFTEVRATDEF